MEVKKKALQLGVCHCRASTTRQKAKQEETSIRQKKPEKPCASAFLFHFINQNI